MKWTRRIDTGNAGATVDLWYRRAAVVLWKCEDHLSVLAEGLDKSATVTLLLKYAKSKSPEFTNKELISCANSIIKSWNPGKYRSPSADLNDKMLKVLNLLSDTDITRQFFRNILSLEYSRSNAGKISESLYHHGLEKFKTELESFVNPDSDRLKSDFPELLLHLTESAKGNTKYLQICKDLSNKFLSALIYMDKGLKKSRKNDRETDDPNRWETDAGGFTAGSAASALKAFLNQNDRSLFGKMINHFMNHAELYRAEKILAPALLLLDKSAFKRSEDLVTLKNYCLQNMKELAVPPEEPKDWKQKGVLQCSCKDCKMLNEFMENPEQKVLKLPLSKNRRKHLHRQIDDYRCEMTHTTDRKTNTETLVCTKTRKKYESRIKRYEQNKKILEKLEKISIGNSP